MVLMHTFRNEATSDLSLTITGVGPHLIVVREGDKVDKTAFLKKTPLSSVYMHVCRHTYIHARTQHAYMHIHEYTKQVLLN